MHSKELYKNAINVLKAMTDLLEMNLKENSGVKETVEQKSDKPEKKIEAPKKAEKQEEKKISLAEVRTALSKKSTAGFTSSVRKLIQLQGVETLTAVNPKKYELLMKQADKIELFSKITSVLEQQEKNGFSDQFPVLFDYHYASSMADLNPDYYESFLRDAKELKVAN